MPTRYISRNEAAYPEILRNYPRMPAGLYLRGSLPDPDRPAVAMVGARACSAYGKRQALHFAGVLAANGVQIISGMAFGIDAWSHLGALEAGGDTFAVLGCGADLCYPAKNRKIYEAILAAPASGILTEFEDGTQPLAWHFPVRNRIISALADLVLVVEARSRSGSLITADYALEQGKNIYAVPGRLEDSCSGGCNELIAQGAGIATCPELLLEVLGVKEYRPACPLPQKPQTASGFFPSERKKRAPSSPTDPDLAHVTFKNSPPASSPSSQASENTSAIPSAPRDPSRREKSPGKTIFSGKEKVPQREDPFQRLTETEQKICAMTREKICSLNDLSTALSLPQDKLCFLLLQLELQGYIEEVVSGFFSCRTPETAHSIGQLAHSV